MEYWFQRLKKLREDKGLSQAKMGRALGTDSTAISRYERSKKDIDLTDNFLMKLNRFFTDEEIEYIKSGNEIEEKIILQESINISVKDDQVTIPYYKDVYASAGGDAQNHDAHRASPITFSKEFLNTFLGIYKLKGISIINAAGDSMDPTIRSGELMFVAPMENEEFKDGGVYVIMCGNVLLVKRVTFNPLSGEYTLVSDNGRVDPVTISIDESSDCRFVGRVVGHLDRV